MKPLRGPRVIKSYCGFAAPYPNNPRGWKSACFHFAVAENVTQQHGAPGRHNKRACDSTECKQRAERDVMRDDTNGQGGGQKGKRGELHVRKKRRACMRAGIGVQRGPVFVRAIVTCRMSADGTESRLTHTASNRLFNDVLAKPSILSAGLMRAGAPGRQRNRLSFEQSGVNKSSEVQELQWDFAEKMSTECLTLAGQLTGMWVGQELTVSASWGAHPSKRSEVLKEFCGFCGESRNFAATINKLFWFTNSGLHWTNLSSILGSICCP